MREDVAGLADQLRWAAKLTAGEVPSAEQVLICGVGGSMHAGDVARLVCSEHTSGVSGHRSYGLPSWAAAERPLVLAISYSGNTEETRSSVAEAAELGLDVAVVTSGGELGDWCRAEGRPVVEVPGGLPPRVAVGYQAGAALAVLESAGMARDVASHLSEAADVVEERVAAAEPLAADLATALEFRIPVVIGGEGAGAVAAMRWKTQINENAKLPAFAAAIPESNHNDLEGWAGGSAQSLALVGLYDATDHPRIRRRLDKTLRDLADHITVAGSVESVEGSVLARLFSLEVVGDLVSVELAERREIDPYPIDRLEAFKQTL